VVLHRHLHDESGREFGYELTFFVVNVQKRDYSSRFGVNRVYISHFAVSDIWVIPFIFLIVLMQESMNMQEQMINNEGLDGNNVLEGTYKGMRVKHQTATNL